MQTIIGAVRPSLNTLLELFDRSLGEAGNEAVSSDATRNANANTALAEPATATLPHTTPSDALMRRARKRGISFAVLPIIGEGESDVSARGPGGADGAASATSGSSTGSVKLKFSTDALLAMGQFLRSFVSLVRLATPERQWLAFRFLLLARLESVRDRARSNDVPSVLSELFAAHPKRTVSAIEWTLLAEQLRRSAREDPIADAADSERIGSLERLSEEVPPFTNLQKRVEAARANTSDTSPDPTLAKVLRLTHVSSDLFESSATAPAAAASSEEQRSFTPLQSVLLVGAVRPALFAEAMSACAVAWGYQHFTDPQLRSLLEAPLTALSLDSIFELFLRTSSSLSTPITLFHVSKDIGIRIYLLHS